MNISVTKAAPDVKLPVYATKGSACFDIYAYSVKRWSKKYVIFGTGLFFNLPTNKVLLIYSRSGHGFNSSIRLANCTGVIDSDYKGEVLIKLILDEEKYERDLIDMVYTKGRIAQGMILDVPKVDLFKIKEVERNEEGFGSTGTE